MKQETNRSDEAHLEAEGILKRRMLWSVGKYLLVGKTYLHLSSKDNWVSCSIPGMYSGKQNIIRLFFIVNKLSILHYIGTD